MGRLSQRCVGDRGEQGKKGFNWPPTTTSNNIWAPPPPPPLLEGWPEKGYSGQIDRVMTAPRELKGEISSELTESL